jgi:hypothetical protein
MVRWNPRGLPVSGEGLWRGRKTRKWNMKLTVLGWIVVLIAVALVSAILVSNGGKLPLDNA